jgi:hypothetical protein
MTCFDQVWPTLIFIYALAEYALYLASFSLIFVIFLLGIPLLLSGLPLYFLSRDAVAKLGIFFNIFA